MAGAYVRCNQYADPDAYAHAYKHPHAHAHYDKHACEHKHADEHSHTPRVADARTDGDSSSHRDGGACPASLGSSAAPDSALERP